VSETGEAYLALLERLEPGNLDELDGLVADTVRFRDPFNDVTGRAALRRVFERMFDDLDVPRFVVRHKRWDGGVCLVAWTFEARMQGSGKDLRFDGMSEVRVDTDGRVAEHVDHWDPARSLYERVPVLGAVLRRVRRRLSSG